MFQPDIPPGSDLPRSSEQCLLEKTIAFSDECFSDVDDNAADRIIDQIILGGTADNGDNGDNGDK